MKKLKEFKAECMQDPEFVKAYEDMQPEFNVIRALVDARTSNDLTQKELSEVSDVPLRQIQLFEQRQRDINKCQAETLLRLSKALKCNIEDILEI